MIDVNNESGAEVDAQRLMQTAAYVLAQLRIHPQADLSVVLVDEDTMTGYHERFLNLPGATDVLSFPMDELRPGNATEAAPRGLLGDIVLCPAVAARQADEHARGAADEMDYLLIHGILHLLGYDHAETSAKQVMFALNDKLYAKWQTARETK